MQKTTHFCFAVLALSAAVCTQAARPVEFTVGTEYYKENYREYKDGERLMRQKGNLWSLTGGVKYRFNDRHAAKLEGRYSRGKSDYTGRYQDGRGNVTEYGTATFNGSPRRVYDVRALYEYTHPINDRVSLTAGAGVGHRVLKDLGSRIVANNYDRKNRTTYAQINAGVNIALPAGFEVSPNIAYNHSLRSRQHSYRAHQDIEMKQPSGHGIEVEVPVSKKFANESKISVVPFYRGWKVKKSDTALVYLPDGIYGSTEPKNYTHEAGVKVRYTF